MFSWHAVNPICNNQYINMQNGSIVILGYIKPPFRARSPGSVVVVSETVLAHMNGGCRIVGIHVGVTVTGLESAGVQ